MTTSRAPFPLTASELDALVRAALAEDRAAEDLTTSLLVPPEQLGRAVLLAKADGVLAGLPVARAAFLALDPFLAWLEHHEDGDPIVAGDYIALVEGRLAPMLSAERVALNFLQHLSGVATAAAAVVERIEGTGCRLRDTRKTLPGFRALQKYAVLMGGGTNHRLDLADGVLVKDNHLAALRARDLDIEDAVSMIRGAKSGLIEVEVTSYEEAARALDAGVKELLLDNLSPEEMREIVELARGRAVLEASGGITLENVRTVAESGVDYLSMGALTHSVKALDISLEVEPV
ncbi:MAG TPA: carboxylating nicotinate-nucleotide diphosphorylase [Dehalococcoidia bacterium]|nr:carboxylating nicotinate-nucleotide diphosphorylase [Dehalococcoidia bacterium]